MFRRRRHQYIAVFLHNRGSGISVLTREISTKRKVDLSLMDEIRRLVCEKEGFKQDDLGLLNFIYLGKGVERNVRTMETSQPVVEAKAKIPSQFYHESEDLTMYCKMMKASELLKILKSGRLPLEVKVR